MSHRVRPPAACALAVAGLLLATGCGPIAPDQQGVLVGLTSGRTLWIAWPNDTARLVVEHADLLVPGDDGFWWVGVVDRCTWGEGGGGWVEDSIFVSLAEAVFVARPGEDARVQLDGMPCEQAEKEVLRERAKSARAPADSVAAEEYPVSNETLYCYRSTRQVTYASPSVLSVEARHASTEFCSPAKYYTSGDNIVRRFGSSERVALRPLLEPTARTALEQHFSDTAGCGYPAEDPGAQIDSSWSIRRHQGAWVARLWIEGPIVCRGGQDTEGGEAIPPSFTGEAPLPIPWSELVRQLPNALDATASPSGAYLLAQRADSLIILPVAGGRLGAPLGRMHIGYGEELAMIRWATAEEARRWSATLPTLQPPRVHVMPDSGTPSP